MLEHLAERIGAAARASVVYGDPVERSGVTVIPVARASWGFGGGSGSGPQGGQSGQGTGGGAGMTLSPVGYIELRDGATRFQPIYDPNRVLLVAATVGGGFAAAMVLRAVQRLLRGR
jgi:uncharacterized spore protein YtfJ